MDRRNNLGMKEDGEIYGNGLYSVLVCFTEIKVNISMLKMFGINWNKFSL